MKSTLIHPTLGEITISRTLRSRRISITVRPTGEVRLSFPPYVAKRRALKFLGSRAEWILQAKAKYAKRPTPAPLTAEDIERLRAEAKAYLPQRVAELAQLCGLRYGKVTIRAARTKWGSCTSKGNISLSLFLMTLPPHLRDYVIIHELCHTVHHNHSPRFHAFVDRLLDGQEKALAKELRHYHIQ